MDNLFKIRTLTAAVNALKAPSRIARGAKASNFLTVSNGFPSIAGFPEGPEPTHRRYHR